MTAPESSDAATRRRVRDAFLELPESHAPLTVYEAAEAAARPVEETQSALEALREEGHLRTKRVGANQQVWWWAGEATDHHPKNDEFRAFVDAVTDYAIFTLEPDGTVASWNQGAHRIKGYTEGEIVGEHFSTFYTEEAIEAGRPEENLERAVSDGHCEDEGWRVRADGTEFYASVTLTAIHDSDGSLRGFTKVTRDMTEQRAYEQQLRTERDVTDQILETVPMSMFVTTAGGEVVRANQRAQEALGIETAQPQATKLDSWELYGDADEPIPSEEYPWRTVLETDEAVYHYECQIDSPAAERRWLSINVAPQCARDDDDDRLVFAVEDITEKKKREAQLERRKAELETESSEIFGRVSDAFYALDEDWRFTHLNQRANDIINLEGRELVGKNVWEEFPAATERKFKPKFETAMFEQETVSFEEYYPEPIDTWFEVRAYPSETGLSVYFRDISDRRERERRLRESEQRYRTLVQNFPDGLVALFDEDLRCVAAGGELLEALGIDREEALGESVTDRYSGDFLDEILPHFEAALRGEERTFEIELDDHYLSAHTIPVDQSPDGKIGMIVSQDITEEREYKRKLEESNERLEQFAYAASHDLQEPLRMVSSYLTLIENRYEDELDEDGREFIAFAVDGADRMRDMIDGLLAYSRVDTAGDTFEPVDLNDVLADVRGDLRMRIEETDADIEVESLPTVEGDDDQLRQVFQNLLSNAIEYSGEEPPQVRIEAEQQRDRWVFSVHDEGIGIDPDDRERIFDVFQSLHGPEDSPGTGIGLALCRRIVERHGGEIWVDETAGPGSTFRFTIPVVRSR